jgi:hypothetical protein
VSFTSPGEPVADTLIGVCPSITSVISYPLISAILMKFDMHHEFILIIMSAGRLLGRFPIREKSLVDGSGGGSFLLKFIIAGKSEGKGKYEPYGDGESC